MWQLYEAIKQLIHSETEFILGPSLLSRCPVSYVCTYGVSCSKIWQLPNHSHVTEESLNLAPLMLWLQGWQWWSAGPAWDITASIGWVAFAVCSDCDDFIWRPPDFPLASTSFCLVHACSPQMTWFIFGHLLLFLSFCSTVRSNCLSNNLVQPHKVTSMMAEDCLTSSWLRKGKGYQWLYKIFQY